MTAAGKPVRVLVVDDDDGVRRVLERHLEDAGYAVATAADGEAALAVLLTDGACIGALVTDLQMPGMSGLDLLAEAKRLVPALPAVVITAHGSVDSAVEAMRHGAFDYVQKPFHRDVLLVTLERALGHRALVEENLRLTAALAEHSSFEGMIGGAPAMRALFREATRIAGALVPVLLLGESGTGKELLARALHRGSPRARGPFVALNLAAVPEPLVEAELFGVEKGAFTGADVSRSGAFRSADGGTLLLDEIGDADPALQAKLLRVLESGEVRAVGADRERTVDVRVLAATNRDLPRAVEEGVFRRDLYHRIAVVTLELPPLRERLEDLPLLVQHFLAKHGAAGVDIDPEVLRALAVHAWPGNVRELENEVRRWALLRHEPERVGIIDLSDALRDPATADPGPRRPVDLATVDVPVGGVDLGALERTLIERALERVGGNRTKAAALLGITRQTLLYRLEKHGLE